MYKLFALLIIIVSFAGCSCSSSEKTSSRNGSSTPNSNGAAVRQSDRPAANPNPETTNANLTPTRAEVIAKLRQKRLEMGNAPASEPLPEPQFRPARDNSMVSTTMNSEGDVVETRIFKNNPQISKVEMKWVGPKNSALKIFLKDGRIVNARGGNIENLGATPVATLLQMASVK